MKRPARAVFVLSILLAVAVAGAVPRAHSVSYVPGVKAGDWAKYSATTYWNSNIPGVTVPQLITQVQHISDMTVTVLSVTGDIVTASQLIDFNNGTLPRTVHLQGSVLDGSGNITGFVNAGGLSAGDKMNTSPTSPTVNYTSVGSFAGALRSVDVYNVSFSLGTISDFVAIQWERYSGFSFDLMFSLTGYVDAPGVHYTARGLSEIKVTQTSASHAPPDFSITGDSSLTVTAGTQGNLMLTLHSQNGFAGKILLAATSSQTGATISVQPSQVMVPVDGQVDAKIFLNSTSVGDYPVTITATGGTLSHTKTETFSVQAPAQAPPPMPASFLQRYMLPIELAAVGVVALVLVAILLVVRRKPTSQPQPSPWGQPSAPPPTPTESPPATPPQPNP